MEDSTMLSKIKIPLLVAAGISATLTGFYVLGKDNNAKKGKEKNQKRRKGKKKSHVSREKLIAFTTDFKSKVKLCRYNSNLQQQEIQSRAQQQGIEINAMEMHAFVKQDFTKGIKKQEQKLYDTHNITEAGTKVAAKKYQDDPEYKELRNDIQKIYQKISNPPTSKPAALIDLDKFQIICKELINGTNRMWDNIEQDVKKKRANGSKLKMENVLKDVRFKTQDLMDELFEKFNIEISSFEASLIKHNTDPSIRSIFHEMQTISQQRITGLGLPTRGRMPM